MFTVMEIIPQIILICFFSSAFPMLSDWQSKLDGKPYLNSPQHPSLPLYVSKVQALTFFHPVSFVLVLLFRRKAHSVLLGNLLVWSPRPGFLQQQWGNTELCRQ